MKKTVSPAAITLVELIVVIIAVCILAGLALPAIQVMRENARRTTCNQRLVQLHLALCEYQIDNEYFPAGTMNPTSPVRSLPVGFHHNWIAAILPFLKLQALYEQIDHSKSVYDRANAQARQTPLAAVRCPSASGNQPINTSNFAGIHSSIEVPIGEDNNGVLMLNRALSPQDINDGMEYTMFVGEKFGDAQNDLGWISGTRATIRNVDHPINDAMFVRRSANQSRTEPSELYVGGLSSAHPGGANLLMGSGVVRFFASSGDRKLLQQMANRNDDDDR